VGLALFVPPAIGLGRGRPWAWTWQLVALILSIPGSCVSLSGCGLLSLVPAVLLLYFWLQPEVKGYCQ
jgi:hypothetical protein